MKQDELYLEAAEKYAAPRPIAGDPSHAIKLRRWNRQRVSVEEIEAAPDSAKHHRELKPARSPLTLRAEFGDGGVNSQSAGKG